MADDGITTIEDIMKVLLDERDNCHRSLAADVPPKKTNGDYYKVYCQGEWDELVCWPNSPPGSIKAVSCPKYIEDFDHTKKVTRCCKNDGTWHSLLSDSNRTWTDYSECVAEGPLGWDKLTDLMKSGEDPQSRSLIQVYTVGYSFSLVALIFAIIIFGYFKRLHCTRNYIHMHLFASFILRAAVVLVKDRVLFYGSSILDVQTQGGEPSVNMPKASVGEATARNNSYLIGCRIVITLLHYCLFTNHCWILVESLYLHSLVFVTFFSDKNYLWRCTIIGWGVPVLFVVPWAIVRATLGNTLCWNIAIPQYKWISCGPIVVANVINFLLFLNIIRALRHKIRERGLVSSKRRTDNRRQCKKLAKSTLVLIPMFGIHTIVFIGMPDYLPSSTWRDIRVYFDLFFNSFQGFLVAIIYCFRNGEVQAEFKKNWERFNLSIEIQRGKRARSRSSATMLATFNTADSHQRGTFPARQTADVVLPIAKEVDLEDEFEVAVVEDHAHDQISSPALSFDIIAVENEEDCDKKEGKLCDVIGRDGNSAAWRKRRSCAKRAESEHSGVSNLFSSIWRGSEEGEKTSGSQTNQEYCGDNVSSGGDVGNAFEGRSDVTEKPE